MSETKQELDEAFCKGRMLEMLAAFDQFCEKNGLTYFLTFGTLLGAIRHKGFIPWDDDVDISMPRKDYDRLIQLCDCLVGGDGVVDLNRRMADIERRYGAYPRRKWDTNLWLKAYFDKKCGKDIYEITR